ncbi:MAG: BON domain-containing protein [Candidatus Caenarcaniphilales bacterium]|nr:BON domain-containing protein [Candidatus Caenarcaniphilales bacterium]
MILKRIKVYHLRFFLLISLTSLQSLLQPLKAYSFGDSIKKAAENVAEGTVRVSRVAGSKITDASITSAVKASLLADPSIEAYRINVDTRKKVVYLKGNVNSQKTMVKAIHKAQRIKGVRTVVNMLRIYH